MPYSFIDTNNIPNISLDEKPDQVAINKINYFYNFYNNLK